MSNGRVRNWLLSPVDFPYRNNSLNQFRLILAFLVLFAHGYYIIGRKDSPVLNGENLGGWAVIGFFVISGFLITRSRLRSSPGDYLVHRVARIIPAFLVCLVVTAAVFGPIALWATRGSLDGYLTAKPSPLQYVWSNLFLHIDGYQIGETLTTVPYPNTWNGSLWTLWFEFLCYLLIWVLGGLAIFRRSIIFVAGLWIVAVVIRGFGVHGINAGLDTDFDLLMRLLPYFLGGSLVYFVIDRCGLVRLLGLLAIPAAAVLMVFVQDLGGPLAAPLIGYALLTLSTFIPQPGWVARNDVSYGFYIYAWPVQQLSVIFGAAKVGLLGYTAVTTVGTLVFAVASWFLVERPVMRLARGSKTSATAEPDPGASQQPQAQQQQP